MNTTVKRIIYIVITILIVGALAYPKLPKGEDEGSESTTTSSSRLTVNGMVLRENQLDNQVNVTGTILADESVALNAEVAGKVSEIYFQEGQSVNKGDLLVRLNEDEIRAELEKLQFTRQLNEDNEYRQKQLLEKEAISREEYETALTTLNTTRAEIKVLESRLDKYQIRAPFDGVIGLRNISEGSYLNPGTPIAELFKINPIKLEFNVPSKYLDKINVGDDLEFTVDSYEGITFKGKIYAFQPQINPETRSIRIRARAENQEGKLLPGQFTRIRLILETLRHAMMVPSPAVIPELNGKKVFLYKNGIVSVAPVETGIRTEDQIQLTSGVAAGDTVITTGLLQINQGTEVNINIQ